MDLKTAEKELEVLKAKYDLQRDLVEDIKEKELLPERIKDFEGKHFVYRNSYGNGDGECWNVYFRVIKLNSYNRADVVRIEKDSYGKIEISKEDMSLSVLTKEISKSKYDKEVEKLFDEAKSLFE